MTVEVARRRTRKTTKGASATTSSGSLSPSSVSMPAMAIGEIDQTIFACPDCARPLALGAHKCPGCGVHLINGVQVRRVSVFVGIGIAGGLAVAFMVSAVGSALAGAAVTPDPAAVVTPTETASSAPATEAPSQPAPTAATGSTVPGIVRSALAQVATVDQRMATSAAALHAALAASEFDTIAVSQILRSMSADAVGALQLAPYVASWSGGVAASAEMTTFYTSVQQTAAEGFKASIRNKAAYQAAATAMVEVLEGLDALDEHVRDAAAKAGVVLPPAGSTTP
jgi:hypothetical protein